MTLRILFALSMLLLLISCGADQGDSESNVNQQPAPQPNSVPEPDPTDPFKDDQPSKLTSNPGQFGFHCPDDNPLRPGITTGWPIDGIERKFKIVMPADTQSRPVGVIFSWHGIEDNVENWTRYFKPQPDGDPEFPFIHVALHDTGMFVFTQPVGMYWDIFVSELGDNNREALLFEAILGCLDRDHKIDPDRIYSVGFSGGAIATQMLHSRYPKILHTTFAWSGAWFNDPAQVETVNAGNFDLRWDALKPDRNATHLMTMGGDKDAFITVLNFDKASRLAVPFLTALDRTVIACTHTNGHQPHPALWTSAVVRFFKDHKRGQVSPYRQGLPDYLANVCKLFTNDG